jgi:Fe-S cluster assembly scaffold protein SufB
VYHIEEEALFYLMSRGISESDAKRMLVKGFLESVVLQLPASLQSMALSLLESRADAVLLGDSK